MLFRSGGGYAVSFDNDFLNVVQSNGYYWYIFELPDIPISVKNSNKVISRISVDSLYIRLSYSVEKHIFSFSTMDKNIINSDIFHDAITIVDIFSEDVKYV